MNQNHSQKYIYLHGFASSPQSRKALFLKEKFALQGITLEIPDLNQNDFSHLSLTRQIAQTASLFNSSQNPVTIIGSSFGGLTATWLAQQYTQVQRLVLLAPAFGFPSSWFDRFDEAELTHWQETGYKDIYHYGEQKALPLHYEFLLDGKRYPLQELKRSLPTLIIHGKNDAVVPVEVSQQYSQTHSQCQLVVLNSDHGLNDKQDIIWQEIWRFISR